MLQIVTKFIQSTGFMGLNPQNILMILISFVLLYLAIKKGFEPLLLVPIAFGMFLTNLPFAGMMVPHGGHGQPGGLLWYFFQGDELGIFPPIIFMGVGAMTDFGPLIANPKALLLGAAAQFGIFTTFFGAILLDFTGQQAGAIGIIGGADGPTAIFLASKLAPDLLGPIAVAAYSYMALVPIIQPPIMKALTTKKERRIVMKQLRPVSKVERVLFPIIVTLLCGLLLPGAVPLLGMLMFGNLMRESGVVNRLSDVAQNALNNMIVIFLGLTVGATATADVFLRLDTLGIIALGLFAFA